MNVKPKEGNISVPYNVRQVVHLVPEDLHVYHTRMKKETEVQKKLVEKLQELLLTVKELHEELVHYKTFESVTVQTDPTDIRQLGIKPVYNVTVKANGTSEQYHDQTRNGNENNRASFDERECLANALQFHVEIIIDGIVFHESELPDCLLAEGCLTEDECAGVRKLRDRKDQIRILLSLIKGRDLRVLKGFVKHIENQNPTVAAKVKEKFEDNKNKGVISYACSLCQLEKQFNIKHVVDSLWANQLIDDYLYNTIIHSESPVGSQLQGELWSGVIQTLNRLDVQKERLAHEKLLTALRSKDLFTHLADGVQSMLKKNHGKLLCSCGQKLRYSYVRSSTSEPSIYPPSSTDEKNDYSGSSTETHDRTSSCLEKIVEINEALTKKDSDIDENGQSKVQGRSGLNSQTFPKTTKSAGVDPNQANASTSQNESSAHLIKPGELKQPFETDDLRVAMMSSNTILKSPGYKPPIPKKPENRHRLKKR